MEHRKILSFLLTFLLSVPLFAQPGGPDPDPNMVPGASLSGISNIYNTNFFDGTVNVSIPIYNFQRDGGNYSIALAYNTRGVQVDETVSPAGCHWNVLAESKIERVIKDIPDEIIYTGDDSITYYNGNNEYNYVNKNKYVRGKLATYWETPAQQSQEYVYRDGESDDFMVSIGGRTFMFNLGNQLQVFTSPQSEIKVRPMLNGAPLYSVTNQNMGMSLTSDVLQFQIVDEGGNQFFFVAGEYEEKSYYDDSYLDGLVMFTCKPITQWVVSKVIFADGNEIRYDYEHSWITGMASSFSLFKNHSVIEASNGTFTYEGSTNENYIGGYSQLKSIHYPNNVNVNLIYSATEKNERYQGMLNEFQIESDGNCVRYLLTRSLVNQRWFLDKIRFSSCDYTLQSPYYSFAYNPLELPQRGSPAQDFYGFYNGDLTNTPIQGSTGINIPKHNSTTGLLNYGSSRMSNYTYAKAGLLNTVKNGFGGEVNFKYSGNDFAYPILPSLPTGEKFLAKYAADGLKVDSIIEQDKFHPGNRRITKITYDLGQIFISGGYFHYPYYANSSGVVEKERFQNMFLSPHQFVNGSNHGYTFVQLQTMTEAGALISKKELVFTNMSDATSGFTPRYFRVPGSMHFYEFPYTNKKYIKDWEIGLPVEITNYDQNNKLVSQTKNNYYFSSVDLSASTYIINKKKSLVNTGTQTLIGGNGWYYPNKIQYIDSYFPYRGIARLSSSINLKYITDSRYISDTIWYDYDGRNNLNIVTTFDSRGVKFKTKMIYNYDVDGPQSPYPNPNPGTDLYNMSGSDLQRMVSTERWEIGPGIASGRLISAFVKKLKFQYGRVLEKGLYNMNNEKPLSYTEYTGLPLGGPIANPYSKILSIYNAGTPEMYQSTSEVLTYDSKGNPLEMAYANGKHLKAAIWDTATNNKLAEVSNATYNDIAYTSFEDVGLPSFFIERGNLDLNSTKVINTSGSSTITSVSGKFVYHLSPAPSSGFNFSDVNGKKDLSPGKEYVLSLWVKGTTPQVFMGSTLLANPPQAAFYKGDWRNYQYKITPTIASKIRISPTSDPSTYLDEIRLFPSSASMESFTYEPIFGVSSMTDPAGRIANYEFDKLGRPIIIRDQEGNINSKTKYYLTGGN